MKRATKTTWMSLGLMILIGWAAGCGAATEVDAPLTPTDTVDVDYAIERGDAMPWKTSTTGMTMWVDTTLVPVREDGERRWVLRGRTSRSLSAFRAYDERGRAFPGDTVSARVFEVRLSDEQAIAVVGGTRLYFDLFTTDGEVALYHGMARFAPRLTQWGGATDLYVNRAINPVVLGTTLKFRGRVKTAAGFALEQVAADDVDPTIAEASPRAYLVDFSPRELLNTVVSRSALRFVAHDTASTPQQKTARLQLRIVQLGLGTEPPFTAWPRPVCDADVLACLNTLTTADTEPCGWANEVLACTQAAVPPVATKYRFVEDLREVIAQWYAEHEADVRARDGRTLRAALNALDVERVNSLSDSRIEQLGYNPEHYDAFSHVDTVYRASPKIWIGVYDHAGVLFAVHTEN